MQEHNTGSENFLGPGLWVLLQKAHYFVESFVYAVLVVVNKPDTRSPGDVPDLPSTALLSAACSTTASYRQSNVIMPTKYVRDDGHSKKHIKSGPASRNTTYRYSDGADVQRCIQTSTNDGLIDGEKFALRRRPTQTFFSCSPHRTSQPTYNKIRGRTNSA